MSSIYRVPSVTFTPNQYTPALGTYRPVSEHTLGLYTRVPSTKPTAQEFDQIKVRLQNVVSLRADAILHRGYVSVTVKQANGTEHTGLVLPSLSVGIQWGAVKTTTTYQSY